MCRPYKIIRRQELNSANNRSDGFNRPKQLHVVHTLQSLTTGGNIRGAGYASSTM